MFKLEHYLRWAILDKYIMWSTPRCNTLTSKSRIFCRYRHINLFQTLDGERSALNLHESVASLPGSVSERKRHENWIGSLPLLGLGPRFAISDVSSCPDGLMLWKIENPRLRRPDISRHRQDSILSCSFHVICSILTRFCEPIAHIFILHLSTKFEIFHLS